MTAGWPLPDGVPSRTMGATALVRLAGLPFDQLVRAGAPELLAWVADLDRRETAYRATAREVADRIGERLVPDERCTARDRAQALRLRRDLHNGRAPESMGENLAAVDAGLAAAIADLTRLAAELAAARAAAAEAIAAEEYRLLALPWRVLRETPAGRHAVDTLAVGADIAARLAAGQPWTAKRMRRRSEHLWRLVHRGAARATPRGWLAHIAAVPLTGSGWDATTTLAVRAEVATELVGNLAMARAATRVAEHAGQLLAAAPLAWTDHDHVSVWVVEGDETARLVRVRVRRTPVLDAVWEHVAGAPRPVDDLLDVLAGTDPPRRDTLRRFLDHLVSIGAVQATSPPVTVATPWHHPQDAAAHGGGTYLDVYRRPALGLAQGHAERLARLVTLALRVTALAETVAPHRAAVPPLTDVPRPLLDVVADWAGQGDVDEQHDGHRHGWAPSDGDTGYGRLVRHLAGRFDAGAVVVDITAADLDACDAPDVVLDWPVDALLRPMGAPGPLAALADVAPAGLLDARFVPALTGFGVELPQVDAYREFLDRLSATAGVPFVEVLFPPLSTRAANAVRRPGYTRFWSGDPDRAAHFPDLARAPSDYIPLSAITLRRDGPAVVAEAHGARIWPIAHTVRATRLPWDLIQSLLFHASPQAGRHRWAPLTYALGGWPGRDHVPRITVGGGLVITPAQWRLRSTDLGEPGTPMLRRLTALTRLRDRLALPRWVTLAADPHDEPVAADLDSLRCLAAFDAASTARSTVLVTEMLPDPEHLAVNDLAAPGGSAAELLLRLPLAETPETMATRAASTLHRPPAMVAGRM